MCLYSDLKGGVDVTTIVSCVDSIISKCPKETQDIKTTKDELQANCFGGMSCTEYLILSVMTLSFITFIAHD